MKRTILAATVALLTAGQGQAKVFDADDSPQQVGACLASIYTLAGSADYGGNWSSINQDAWRSVERYNSKSPNPQQTHFGITKGLIDKFRFYLATTTLSDNDPNWARGYVLRDAVDSRDCKFAIRMTPAEAWPEAQAIKDEVK